MASRMSQRMSQALPESEAVARIRTCRARSVVSVTWTFQNWTRSSSEIMGSVFLWADYTVPLEALRQETKRIVESHPKWDHKFWNLQVTDTTDRSVQLRVLATASDSGKAWDMRCDIREQLINFLQKNYPGALPKVRAEMQPNQTPA